MWYFVGNFKFLLNYSWSTLEQHTYIYKTLGRVHTKNKDMCHMCVWAQRSVYPISNSLNVSSLFSV